MYQKIIDRIHNKLAAAGDVEGYESKQLRYMIDAIVSEVSKTILLIVLFGLLGQLKPLVFALIALMVIRPFTGGLHFSTYLRCLAFTVVFFGTAVIVANVIDMVIYIYGSIICFAIISLWLIGPIQSKNRPRLNLEGVKRMKLLATLILLTHGILYFVFPEVEYLSVSGPVFMLQFIQLTLAKGVEIYEKNVQKLSKSIM